MFFAEGQIRVHLCGAPTAMRKAYHGPQALTRPAMGQDPLSGALYDREYQNGELKRIKDYNASGVTFRDATANNGRGQNYDGGLLHCRNNVHAGLRRRGMAQLLA